MGGRVIEGWRASATPGTGDYDPRAGLTPVYTASNIRRLRLRLSDEHWTAPTLDGDWCVTPGDVAVNKVAPVRAALISSSDRRHPVDGNSLLVRALPLPAAAWVALCLNHPGYEQLLLMESGVLKRVGVRALAMLRVPPTPLEMTGLSVRLSELLEEFLMNAEVIQRARREAAEVAADGFSEPVSLRNGTLLEADVVSHESWLPSAVALRSQQAALEKESGWAALATLAAASGRERLNDSTGGARVLRLGDVGDDLFVPAPETAGNDGTAPRRILDNPLIPGEVLVSTLGRSFRAVYVDDSVPSGTYPADGWVRLRFRETPAAWALLLSTGALRSQAARLVVGSVQQFVPPDALRSLRVPVPPREIRDRWQRAIERHHAQRRTQDRQWATLISEMTALFETVHRPFSEERRRAKEVIQ